VGRARHCVSSLVAQASGLHYFSSHSIRADRSWRRSHAVAGGRRSLGGLGQQLTQCRSQLDWPQRLMQKWVAVTMRLAEGFRSCVAGDGKRRYPPSRRRADAFDRIPATAALGQTQVGNDDVRKSVAQRGYRFVCISGNQHFAPWGVMLRTLPYLLGIRKPDSPSEYPSGTLYTDQ